MKKPWYFWALAVLGGVLFFWLVVIKIVVRFIKKEDTAAPCPFALSWIVDNPLRKWDVRNALRYAGIRAGETVIELGPGPGAFTCDAARLVGSEGKVIAVDIQPEMIEKVKERARTQGIANIQTHVASGYDLPVEDSSVDRVFLVTVLPEVPDPVRCLSELKRVLKPGGIVSVTEEFLDPDYPLRSTTIAWAKDAGFNVAGSYGNWWCYTLNFRKV